LHRSPRLETNGFDIQAQANDVPGQWGVHPIDTARQLRNVTLNQWFVADGQNFLAILPGPESQHETNINPTAATICRGVAETS
jgi:hypothetical protein